jgi:hypothetical protein
LNIEMNSKTSRRGFLARSTGFAAAGLAALMTQQRLDASGSHSGAIELPDGFTPAVQFGSS